MNEKTEDSNDERPELPRHEQAAEVRTQHIEYEKAIRLVGTISSVSGIVLCFGVALGLFTIGPDKGNPYSIGHGTHVNYANTTSVLAIIYGILLILIAPAIRKLKPWSRVPAGMAALVALIQFPFGTLCGIYSLHAMFRLKADRVFAADYRDIVEATPDVGSARAGWPGSALILVALLLTFGATEFMDLNSQGR